MKFALLLILSLGVTVASAQQPKSQESQSESQTPSPTEPQPEDSAPAPQPCPAEGTGAQPAPKPGHPLDPEDVRILTGRPITSVPAADRTGYGAPQVYLGPTGQMGYGFSMFRYNRRVPLFNAPFLAPLPIQFGFVPRPIRPMGPFQFFTGSPSLGPFASPFGRH